MLEEQEDGFYYVTLMNENYVHPAMPEGAQEGILRGMYRLREAPKRSSKPVVQLLGSGTILREAIAAADLLEEDFGVLADVWSVTSFSELRRDGLDVERWNMLHPSQKPRVAYVSQQLSDRRGPVIASTDYLRAVPDQIRQWVVGAGGRARSYRTLGTDGYGRSDFRAALRRFFEVDRHYVAVAALTELADAGTVDRKLVAKAIAKYEIDADAPSPTTI
jgi:pyruvate dehydrogenase E1 component